MTIPVESQARRFRKLLSADPAAADWVTTQAGDLVDSGGNDLSGAGTGAGTFHRYLYIGVPSWSGTVERVHINCDQTVVLEVLDFPGPVIDVGGPHSVVILGPTVPPSLHATAGTGSPPLPVTYKLQSQNDLNWSVANLVVRLHTQVLAGVALTIVVRPS